MSSVVLGFEEFRQAAREGIEAAGGEPVLVNEDFPAAAASSRNVCLEAVESSDYLLTIIGQRSGWTAPSGKLVVQEEFEEARRHKRPVIAFIQDGVARDEDAQRFERQVSDYITGNFRRTFRTPAELRREVEASLAPLLALSKRAAMSRPQRDHFSSIHQVQSVAMLRFVLTPERDEEVLDPVRLLSREFGKRVMELGHGGNEPLFSYETAKHSKVEGGVLVIEQSPPSTRHGAGLFVLLSLFESGEVVIDTNISGRTHRGGIHDMLGSMVLALEDIESALRQCFTFSRVLYDEIDRFQRHQTFSFNAALSGLGYRTLERDPQPRSSYSMVMRNRDRVVTAHDAPRRVGRQDLAAPEAEIERATLRFMQKATE